VNDVATVEPDSLRAGDSWEWIRSDLRGLYPAPAWTLTYRFKNASGGFQIVADADGDAFHVLLAPDDTAAFLAGDYEWGARVDDGSTFITVSTGSVRVLPGFFAGDASDPIDNRSHARKVLDAIQAVLEQRATVDQQEYTIGNRSLRRMSIADLLVFRDRYKAMVDSEEAAQDIAKGLGDPRRLYVRFNRV
jgi:hypothetical protein